MLQSFTAALARIQSDYDFYVGCQTNPDATLVAYDLTPEERSALADPTLLARVLHEELRPRNIPSITIKISGRHDWVNRAPKKRAEAPIDVSDEIASVRSAASDSERVRAALALIERIG